MAVRRCPSCGTVNRPTAPVCDCGHVFDAAATEALGIRRKRVQPDDDLSHETLTDQRHYHMHKLTLGWLAIAGFVMLLGASVLLLVLGARISIVLVVFSFVTLAKGVRTIGRARRALRALDGNDGALPRAKLLKR